MRIASGRGYGLFAAAVASWFFAHGMQGVIFSWLVVGELRAAPSWVGTAQMAQILPAALFVVVGGAVADRGDRRRLLAACHLAAAVLVLGLAAVVQAGRLGLPLLIAYAFLFGTLHAVALPIREALLYQVGRRDLSRAVTATTLVQFSAAALGAPVAGAAEWMGPARALLIMAGFAAGGVAALGRLPVPDLEPPVPPGVAPARPAEGSGGSAGASLRLAPRSAPGRPAGTNARLRGAFADVREGFAEVARSPRLAPIALLVGANGLFFMGPYFTLTPVLVRDVYGAGVSALGLAMMMFPLGTIAGSVLLLARGAPAHRGRALLAGLACGAASLLVISAAPPFPVFLLAILAWGLAGSLFLNMSRTLFQEAVSERQRGRVLAVYFLALLGMAPVSNLLAGVLAGAAGAPVVCAGAGVSMFGVVLAAALRGGGVARLS